MYTKGIKILEVKIGIISNNKELIDREQFYYLETNYNKVESIDFYSPMDTYLYIYDEKGIPVSLQLSDERMVITGDIAGLMAEATDKRYGLFGNLGLITRFVLYLLEKKYSIFSFHAASLYDDKEDDLYIVLGSAGSGKTTFLLRAVQEGLKIFATELVHFQMKEIDKQKVPVFYPGALLDNIRIGNLKYDYPKATKMLDIAIPKVENEWTSQVWEVDMNGFAPDCKEMVNPKITFFIPYVERKWEELLVQEVKKGKDLRKTLFDNVSEKVSAPFMLFDELILPSLDTNETLKKRITGISEFMAHSKIQRVLKFSSGTQHSIQEILGSSQLPTT